jgi:hypothetical protein
MTCRPRVDENAGRGEHQGSAERTGMTEEETVMAAQGKNQ